MVIGDTELRLVLRKCVDDLYIGVGVDNLTLIPC